jgi:invasion protein IalB
MFPPAMISPIAPLFATLLLLAPAAGFSQAQAQTQAQKTAPKPEAAKPEAKKPETKRIGSFQGWQAYQLDGKDGRTCYLHGLPEKKEPASVKRGEIYLLVTHKTATKVRNEVSIVFGYGLKPQSPAQASIGKDSFEMFTHGEAAWAADAATDAKLVDALKKGKQLTVKGTSARGTATTDTYSLAGFGEALKAIDKACGLPGATS